MTIRIALVGCGAAAVRLHLPGYRASGTADVTVFTSRTREAAAAARDGWGSGDVVDDWRQAITRDDVDAVDVCVPNALHAEVAAYALDHGKHVLVEKPMTTSVRDADALVAAAAAGGRQLMVAQELRFVPAVRTLRRCVMDGEVGEVLRVRAALGHAGPEAWRPEATWFRDPSTAGGGVLIDLGVHLFDLLPWLVDHRVTEVRAALVGAGGGVDDQADVLLRLGDGIAATAHVSWRVAAGQEAWVRVDGEKGSLLFDATSGVRLARAGVDDVTVPVADDGEPTSPAAAFARALAAGTPVPVTGEDGRRAVAAVAAAYESARSGAPVRLDASG